MAKSNPLDRIRVDTVGLKKDLEEQVRTLKKLENIGKLLGEITDDEDPFQEIIAETVGTVEAMTKLADRLAKMKLPE